LTPTHLQQTERHRCQEQRVRGTAWEHEERDGGEPLTIRQRWKCWYTCYYFTLNRLECPWTM